MLDWKSRAVSPAQAVARVASGDRVFIHGAAATPTPLIDALAARTDLEHVSLYHLHLMGRLAFFEPQVRGRFRSVSLFTGAGARKPVEEGDADFIPIFLSDIPALFRGGVALDAALVQVSPPDRHGLCSLGTSIDAARAAVDHARIVVAEINERMPRTCGNSAIPLAAFDAYTLTDRPLHEREAGETGTVEARIGALVADLVEDGACLQMGIGAIPDAVLARLGTKNDLGVHTEMFSDGLVPLVESGVVNNRCKQVHPGRVVTSFAMGSARLYEFLHDNPLIEFHGCDRTNDTSLIRKNERVVAINSAIEVDLTGQVCADSMGHRIFSGIGGQMDFIRGAALSRGGKPIIALPSTAARGSVSRITLQLREGAGVVTTRGHVHWVATEYGAVNLHGCSLRERAERLISIAHPDFRAELAAGVRNLRRFVLG